MRPPRPPPSTCLYFGPLGESGHYLYTPNGYHFWNDELTMVGPEAQCHIDGTLAPRMVRAGTRTSRDGLVGIVWQAMGETREKRDRIMYDSHECDQGQFLRHQLANGFTAIQWWDRCQGDQRGASNSTILLNGVHTTAEMLEALRMHFPSVLENLEKAFVKLVELLPS